MLEFSRIFLATIQVGAHVNVVIATSRMVYQSRAS